MDASAIAEKLHGRGVKPTSEGQIRPLTKLKDVDQQNAVRMDVKLRPKLSDREIARHCRVSHPTVAAVKAQLEDFASSPRSETHTVATPATIGNRLHGSETGLQNWFAGTH